MYVYPKPTLCTICIDLEAPNVCMWYIVFSFRSVLVLSIHTLLAIVKVETSGIQELSRDHF